MSASTGVPAGTTEYVAVVKLFHCFIATHVEGEQKTFVSEHPETDFKTALVAARSFAEERKIHCHESVLYLDRPLITVIKKGNDWFVAGVVSDGILVTETFRSTHLGNDRVNEAIQMAQFVAACKGTDFIPEIGISLSE